ncbi:MAG TPA: hypothetical protein VHZ31_06815 [Solirubrobacteraceae bacterium]|nr:hypothetical protein [Solirubrobacteraceae bacterium]
MSPSSLAPLLRRWADRLDPPTLEAAADTVLKSRDEIREIQAQALRMIEDYAFLTRGSVDDGLMWFPTDVLKVVAYFFTNEFELRGRDFDAIERDPTVRFR